MGKQRNPNGLGNYRKLKDGRFAWRQKIDGKTRELSAKTMQDLKEKVKQIADLPIIKSKYTVADWFTKWLNIYVKPLKSNATYNQYSDIYRVHICPQIGARKILSVKPVDIQTVIAKMNEKGLSACTMKHAKKVMNIAFKKALSEKIVPVNPVVDIEIPQKQAKQRKVLSNDDLYKLFEQLKSSRWIHCIKFILVTGIRRGETLALKWSDIDFANKSIKIDESNSNTGLKDTKSSKIHYIPLTQKALEFLNNQKEQLKKEFNPILFNVEKSKLDLVFPNVKGDLLKPGSLYTVMARASKQANIHATPHMLRHTFVFMTRNVLSIKELQHILGHDESTTTLDLYGDIIDKTTEETMSKIDDVFKQIEIETATATSKNIKDNVIPFRKKQA